MKQNWITWLVNPFRYFAGWQALAIGAIAMIVTAGIASLSAIRFDGVLDIHFGNELSFFMQLLLLFIDYGVFSLLLLVVGMLMSKSKYRIIDILGTQLFARWPFLFIAILALTIDSDAIRDVSTHLKPENIEALFTVPFVMFLLLSLLTTIWMIVLQYRSFSISFNLSGNTVVTVFAICLLIAEVISKYILLKIIL